jgi:hypothetical protein
MKSGTGSTVKKKDKLQQNLQQHRHGRGGRGKILFREGISIEESTAHLFTYTVESRHNLKPTSNLFTTCKTNHWNSNALS